jgi:hypothetical protein
VIAADRFLLDGDTAWWVFPSPVDLAFAHLHDGPCETCDGEGRYLPCVAYDSPCDEECASQVCDCIDGRHTFEIIVNRACPADTDGDGDCALCAHRPGFHSSIDYRVSIVPGMVLPIREWASHVDPPLGRWLALNVTDGERYSMQECYLTGMTSHPSNITLPSAAAPGMWAVKLRVAS